MDTNQNTQTLINVINTLNQITVSGFENMNKLLGCIQALDRIVKEGREKEDAK